MESLETLHPTPYTLNPKPLNPKPKAAKFSHPPSPWLEKPLPKPGAGLAPNPKN